MATYASSNPRRADMRASSPGVSYDIRSSCTTTALSIVALLALVLVLAFV